MFIRNLFHIHFLRETPEAGGGGAATATPGAVQPGAQPPAGQGAGQGDFWSVFPNVPEEQRPILEPHLRQSQAEITRLQQQQAALRPVMESGYQPQQIQGLINFDQRFQSDPAGVFVDIARMLQQNNVDVGELDLDAVIAYAEGQEPAGEPAAPEGQLDPAVQAYIDRLEARVNEIDQGIKTQQTRNQELVQDNLLKTQHERMRTELQKVGYDPESLTASRLNAQLLMHQGNVQAAIQDLSEMRTGILKGFTQNRPNPGELETRNGGPTPPARESVRDSQDPFAKARAGAHNRLARANRDRVQG
jgi:hypothetical protein